MKHLNRHDLAPRIGIQALCVPLLVSLSPWAAALATPFRAESSTPGMLRSLSPAFDLGTNEDSAGCEDLSLGETAEPLSTLASKVILSSGAIEADVAAFRALLGDPNNGVTPGQQPGGRREINWDAVPAAVTDVIHFPRAFFNTNSPRGLVYDPGTRGLEVSDQRFVDLNPTYAAEFNPFSGTKVFSPLGTTEVDARFFVAGSNVEAGVRGIGVVFMDVDVDGSSGIEVHAQDGSLLARLHAPVRSDARGASFVGIVFRQPVISTVRIVTGTGILSPNEIDISQGGQHDLVVMDDILYGEPTAIGN